ncbi:MAG: DNA polymerase III subunit delta [Tatlockia sp.]|jgi:DNA polymerase-3 subunit delta
MLLKQPALKSHLNQKLAPIYLLFGLDCYLLNKAAEDIKCAFKAGKEVDETVLSITNPSDWAILADEANSYSLFSTHTLIDIRYEKKTLDAPGKAVLTHYLKNINPSCLLLLRTAHFTQKAISWLINQDCVVAVQASALNAQALHHWIAEQLHKNALAFEPQVPALIQQYTQGNMLASAQVIEKLALTAEPQTILSVEVVKDTLVNQCDYQLFELADACLTQSADKAVQLLRYFANTKVEPILVLWMLTQEIRTLIKLGELTKQQAIPFSTACSQLKIWPQKNKLYQNLLNRGEMKLLLQLLRFCQTIDWSIKSNANAPIWNFLEQLTLSLCFLKPIGPMH